MKKLWLKYDKIKEPYRFFIAMGLMTPFFIGTYLQGIYFIIGSLITYFIVLTKLFYTR